MEHVGRRLLPALLAACAATPAAQEPDAFVAAGAAGTAERVSPTAECPPAPMCPAATACPAAPTCPAIAPQVNYATEHALRAPFCRTADGKTWGCETFDSAGEPAGNVTYSAGNTAWSCVLRSPDPSAPNGLGWGPRYTAPLACGAGNACDVTVVLTSGAIEHRAGVCLAQRALDVAP